ncbi:hypothetical protein [Vampirovibrio sp.]|uniref:hypothetical protein n=1 Tax=Vampirovibrio sp. TaxID=2717857 RepID=UPI0035931333
MSLKPSPQPKQEPQALALGSYRNDVAYTGALKSIQALPLGSYRQDVAYTAALKSSQQHALGNYRQDVAYAAALKSGQFSGATPQGGISFGVLTIEFSITGAKHDLAPVSFGMENEPVNTVRAATW